MFDPKVYRELCGELTPSPETIQEVICMTKKQNVRKRRPTRVLAAVAAECAALAITASAANLETIQGFLVTTINAIFVAGENEGGAFAAVKMPEISVEEREGRTILTVDGEEADITDLLAEDHVYTFHKDMGDSSYEVTVDDQGLVTVTGLDASGETLFHYSYEAGENASGVVHSADGAEAENSTVTITVTEEE